MADGALFIKRVSDGEIRRSAWQPDNDRYWWEEGNGGCDCNRALAFGDEYDEVECSEGRFALVNEDGSPFVWPSRG